MRIDVHAYYWTDEYLDLLAGLGKATPARPGRDEGDRGGQAAEIRDAAGNPPASLASFPGARHVQEAVFQVGSGAHEFSGPAMNRG
jgi:hypothetical protein